MLAVSYMFYADGMEGIFTGDSDDDGEEDDGEEDDGEEDDGEEDDGEEDDGEEDDGEGILPRVSFFFLTFNFMKFSRSFNSCLFASYAYLTQKGMIRKMMMMMTRIIMITRKQ